MNYLQSEAEKFIRTMLDAANATDAELKNLMEQRKSHRKMDPEFLPLPTPKHYFRPAFGYDAEIYLEQEKEIFEEQVSNELYRDLGGKYKGDEGFDKKKGIPYLESAEERDPFRVFMSEGKLYHFHFRTDSPRMDAPANDWENRSIHFEPYSSPDLSGLPEWEKDLNKVIFVMDRRGNMYINLGVPGEFHHSSFLAGEPVIFAGEIDVQNGMITHINNSSGHYMPTEMNLESAMKYLKQRDMLHKGIEVKLLAERNQYKGEVVDVHNLESLQGINPISVNDPLFDLLVLQESIKMSLTKLVAEKIRLLHKHGNQDRRIDYLTTGISSLQQLSIQLQKDLALLRTSKKAKSAKETILHLNIKHHTAYSHIINIISLKLRSHPHPNAIKRFISAIKNLARIKMSLFKKRGKILPSYFKHKSARLSDNLLASSSSLAYKYLRPVEPQEIPHAMALRISPFINITQATFPSIDSITTYITAERPGITLEKIQKNELALSITLPDSNLKVVGLVRKIHNGEFAFSIGTGLPEKEKALAIKTVCELVIAAQEKSGEPNPRFNFSTTSPEEQALVEKYLKQAIKQHYSPQDPDNRIPKQAKDEAAPTTKRKP